MLRPSVRDEVTDLQRAHQAPEVERLPPPA